MNFENDQWNSADFEFNNWLKGNKSEGNADHTNILKSTYFVFREKESERLKGFCNKAFDFFIENEKDSSVDIKLSNQKIIFDLAEDILSEEAPMFSRSLRREESISPDNRTKAENDKILHGILSGDQYTFDELYEVEFPKIVRLVTKNSGTLDEAKDIFQDALVVLIEKAYRKELDLTCSIGTNLYSICRNIWLERLRKVKNIISLNDSFSQLESSITFMVDENVPDAF